MNPQLDGIEGIEGTYVFDLKTSYRTMRLNRFLWNMIGAAWRGRFDSDPEGLMTESGLSETEKELVRRRDWLGLIQHGANFFVLEKFARVSKKSNLEVYAEFRGETLEEFLATRRVPDAR